MLTSGRLPVVYLDIQIGFVLNSDYLFIDVLKSDIQILLRYLNIMSIFKYHTDI